MKLKVCGLTKLEQIHQLQNINIDFLGFIFYEKSPRYVLDHLSLEQIAEIPFLKKVGVFVNESTDNILELSSKAKLNFVQLHGDETQDYTKKLRAILNSKIKIIKVIRVGELIKLDQNYPDVDFLLFDTDSSAFGGTGKSFNWQLLNQVNIPLPYFLSGGISDDNVEFIKNLSYQPFALDINSKFEIEAGNKNISKIKAFKSKLINSK